MKSTNCCSPPKSLTGYSVGRTIGRGTFGSVFLAQDKSTKQVFAIKSVQKSKIKNKSSYLFLKNEKQALSQISSQFAVSFYGTFQDENSIYFIQEFVPGGELFSLIASQQKLSVHQSQIIAAEIVLFLHNTHKQGFIYRDLKPENILISSSGHVKIVDFGFAAKLEETSYTFCGTYEYLAPEIVLNKGHRFEADWWTLGILLYEMLVGRSPFASKSTSSMFDDILNKDPVFSSDFDADAKDLIQSLLQKDPKKRLASDEVMKHKFFRNFIWEEVEKMAYQPFEAPFISHSMDGSNFPKYKGVSVSAGLIKFSFAEF